MGCNAGLNALGVTAGWSAAHPGQLAVLLCAEACSAAYVFDSTMRTAVVNSLFGDGAAAVALIARRTTSGCPSAAGPRILSFASHIITDAIDAMRYDWDGAQGKFSFFLDPDIPYVVGAHAELVIDRLLSGTGLRRSDISHWLVHSGGKKVIDAVRVNLGLTRHDVRHTTGVLRDYGNLSSGSFLFSYERLLREGVAQAGRLRRADDHGPRLDDRDGADPMVTGARRSDLVVLRIDGEPAAVGRTRSRRSARLCDSAEDRDGRAGSVIVHVSGAPSRTVGQRPDRGAGEQVGTRAAPARAPAAPSTIAVADGRLRRAGPGRAAGHRLPHRGHARRACSCRSRPGRPGPAWRCTGSPGRPARAAVRRAVLFGAPIGAAEALADGTWSTR